jgi:hypothetical protein
VKRFDIRRQGGVAEAEAYIREYRAFRAKAQEIGLFCDAIEAEN